MLISNSFINLFGKYGIRPNLVCCVKFERVIVDDIVYNFPILKWPNNSTKDFNLVKLHVENGVS